MLGGYSAGSTALSLDLSAGESWDPNGGGMIEGYEPFTPAPAAPSAASTIAMTVNPPATAVQTPAPAAGFSLMDTFSVGGVNVPYWLAGLAGVFGLAAIFGKGGR